MVLTMLFMSERSWKHHYVTVVIPYSYLVCEFFSSRVGPRSRMMLVGSWALSFVLMLATSTEVGGLFAEGKGTRSRRGMASSYGLALFCIQWSPGESGLAGPNRRASATPVHPGRPFPGLISTSTVSVAAGRHVLISGNVLVF